MADSKKEFEKRGWVFTETKSRGIFSISAENKGKRMKTAAVTVPFAEKNEDIAEARVQILEECARYESLNIQYPE